MNTNWNEKLIISLTVLVVLVSVVIGYSYVLPILKEITSITFIILFPFLLAIFIVNIIRPTQLFLERKTKLRRSFSAFILLLSFVIAVTFFFTVLLNILYREIMKLYNNLNQYSDLSMATLYDILDQLKYNELVLPGGIQLNEATITRIFADLQAFTDSVLNYSFKIAGNVPGFFLFLIISIIAAFFILVDYEKMRDKITNYFAKKNMGKVTDTITLAATSTLTFIKVYLFLVLLTATSAYIVFKLLNIEFALLLAIIVGILDIIPVIGPALLLLPWSGILFLTGNPINAFIILLFYIVMMIARRYLEPKIFGDLIGLNPFITLIALYGGFILGGIVGLVVAPVLTNIVIKTIEGLKSETG
ncbi:hypothetical protein SYNTR_0770 [Candidatus Syntrophocurvum alkaliphilum]|uniref:Sporulation integral membrane protein YtvI n=1 Tax=Candidatus Syntrophocurvum alkaliphilum TaxID=2293317 RepID=A0A6I6DG80_9FIRM|nr:AI-2E family transporter [Candidatus Syntrophocurvum alkaliphilum]QGT99363.1 hypothetical protein SYNTR_0770 [Candidatus Syntrophocurvum alkaliphilum]